MPVYEDRRFVVNSDLTVPKAALASLLKLRVLLLLAFKLNNHVSLVCVSGGDTVTYLNVVGNKRLGYQCTYRTYELCDVFAVTLHNALNVKV